MFHSFHLAVQNGRGTFWFLPRKYFDPNLTTIYCEKQWTELHIMEFYSFCCVYYVYYLQFYTLFPAFEADGIQEVSGSFARLPMHVAYRKQHCVLMYLVVVLCLSCFSIFHANLSVPIPIILIIEFNSAILFLLHGDLYPFSVRTIPLNKGDLL